MVKKGIGVLRLKVFDNYCTSFKKVNGFCILKAAYLSPINTHSSVAILRKVKSFVDYVKHSIVVGGILLGRVLKCAVKQAKSQQQCVCVQSLSFRSTLVFKYFRAFMTL